MLDEDSTSSVADNLAIGNTNLLYRWKADLVAAGIPVDSRQTLGNSLNLLLDCFQVDGPNRVWVGDKTYIPLPKKSAYLAIRRERP